MIAINVSRDVFYLSEVNDDGRQNTNSSVKAEKHNPATQGEDGAEKNSSAYRSVVPECVEYATASERYGNGSASSSNLISMSSKKICELHIYSLL